MADSIRFSREVPVRHSVDVCVVGAGPGGVAAAVFAARSGARTLILDAHTMPGGMSTAGRVPVLMNCSDGVNFLPGGFGSEVVAAMDAAAAGEGFEKSRYAIDAERLKFLYEEMLTESGAAIVYYSRLAGVSVAGGRISHAVFAAPGGLFAVAARVFVDGTGDGTLAAWAGAPFRMGDEAGTLMPCTLCSLWTGFDWDAYAADGAFSHNDDRMLDKLDAAFRDGLLTDRDYHHTGLVRHGEHLAGGNITHAFDVDGTDEVSLTRGLVESRRKLRDYENFYRKCVAGFGRARIADSGSLLGVRETRRITGDYILNYEDYLARRTFDDEIGRYNFPVDIHPAAPGRAGLEEHKRFHRANFLGRGESYGIPYRILLPLGLDNLLTCGRCVSTDRNVFASLRVIPGAWITGQAAGAAAALALRKEDTPRAVDPAELRAILRGRGAFFY